MSSGSYDHKRIEAKWQARWRRDRVGEVNLGDARDAYYMLVMFPYPSGDRLHVGHGRNYIMGDVLYRYLRTRGKRPLNPIGWDSFGLPAENAAIERQIHPQDWTNGNIAAMKEQFGKWGILYDWSKELSSCTPEYYRWNQWLFLRMLEKGLAYKREAPVNWCPKCQTVLANEQVVDGRCERCRTEVEQKTLEQWFFRITQFAQRLLDNLDTLDGWPERVKTMQRNWIGRSEGAELDFELPDHGETLTVFTTRPDTINGATFMVLAPEHPLVPRLIADNPERESLEAWIDKVRNTPRIQREAEERQKEGRATGSFALNPANGERIPIWLADYVLPDYGTGSIMAVPAHDSRDLEFARQEGLDVRLVYHPEDEEVDAATMTEPVLRRGVIRDFPPFDGQSDSAETIRRFVEWTEEQGWGRGKVTYRLRDWLISRQRYWGTPIPVVYCEGCGVVPVPEEELPVALPYDIEFTGRRGNPLERHEGFLQATCPKCGGQARRETDTMDTFVDSSWYFLRYLSAKDDSKIFDSEIAAKWCPVDQYIGGIEHAILHLLYARFLTLVLKEFGLVDFEEPFTNLFNQGMITRFSEDSGRIEKMSKSRGNTVSPDGLIDQMGADTERVYTLFLGPPEDEVEWNDEAVSGAYRFLNRVWRAAGRLNDAPPTAPADEDLERLRHVTIERVTRDMDRFKFNTVVAALMELMNGLGRALEEQTASKMVCEAAFDTLLQLLYPFAPHVTEELWETRGHPETLLDSSWPDFDEEKLQTERVTLVVQIDGKLRDRLEVAADAAEKEVVESVMASPQVEKHLAGRQVAKTIVVPGRLVNLVTRPSA
jgi:leucyl-tRNA synthetase